MSIIVNIITVAVGTGLIFIVLRLVMQKKMTEAQSVLWLMAGVVVIVLGIFPNLIKIIAEKLGIYYAPSVLWLAVAIVLFLILFRNSTVLSRHGDEIHELSIQVALLKEENKKMAEAYNASAEKKPLEQEDKDSKNKSEA